MQKLAGYLSFIKTEHLEDAAKENLRLAREMKLPLLKIVEGMPEEVLLAQGMKNIGDFADDLASGNYHRKQQENLRRWENDDIPELKNNDINADDLVLIYPLQRKMLYRFLPDYTTDVRLTLDILAELDDLQIRSQLDAVRVLIKKQQRTTEQLQQVNTFLNSILDHIPNMIFVKEAEDLRFVKFNRAGEQLLGLSFDELTGKNDYDFFREEQADFFTTKDREVLGKGVLVDIPEEKIQAAAGDERWLHTKKIPLRGSDGKPAFLLGISEDITEKRAREEELRRSNDRFDKILKMSPTAIFVSEVETGFFLYVNETFCRLFQVSGKEVAGKTSVDLGISTPERRAEITQNMMRNNGRVRGLEFRYEPAHGEAADLLMSSEIVEFEGKKCFLGSISDITERKRSEEKIARLNDELEESLRQLGTVNKELEAFTYSVSHDLRAPLRAVSGYANMLEEEYNQLLDEEGRRLLGVIRYNAKKMGQLIDDLLAFSRLGRKEIETRPENMQTLVEGVMIELRKTIDYKAKITIGELHTANVDYGLMHQVFLNLISNAIKYSSKKKKPEISISSEVREGEIIYSIRDNGVGFDMRYYDKLFGVFQRLHKMEEFEGTGVGLAIVQRIISKHRGRVWAEAAVNKGANFSFSLPAEKPASLTQTAYGRNQEH